MVQKLSQADQSTLPAHLQSKFMYETGGLSTLSVVNEEHADPEREADFDKAYNKLVKKFYQEQGPNLLIPEEDLYKAEQRGIDVGEVQRRIQEDQRRKDEKLRMLKQIQEEKELEGCTFAPQMLTKKREKRDLGKFLEDQQKYLEMKQKKQLERQEKALFNEQSVMAPVPLVNEKSKRLLEKKLKKLEEGPDQRLSASATRPETSAKDNARGNAKAQEARKRLASPQPTESFKPSISKKS